MLLLAAMVSFGLTSCSSDDNKVPSYPVKIQLQLKDNLTFSDITDLKVVLKGDKGTADTIWMTADTITKTLVEGQYEAVVSGKVNNGTKANVSGASNFDVYSAKTAPITVNKISSSPLIFKAIYTTGGAQYYMKDSYFEIVNNSDEVQYLDGLILSSPMGNQTSANAWQAIGKTDLYSCGQGTVLMFPGSGKEHPLNPGESVLIANDAANHKLLADSLKKEGASLSPDLSKADWEVYLSYVASEVDYSAPNLEVVFKNNQYMAAFGLGVMGRGYVLARLPEGMKVDQWTSDSTYVMTTPGTTSDMLFLCIPSKWVLDAVEIVDPSKTNTYNIFLPEDDAKPVKGSEMYTGKCVRRKVISYANGRPYYKDTNNSSEDFLTNQPLTPGEDPKDVDE